MEKKFGICVILTSSAPFVHSHSVYFYDLSEMCLYDVVKRVLKVNSDFFDVTNNIEMTLTICFGHSSVGIASPDLSSSLLYAEHSGNNISIERDLLGIDMF